MTRRSVIGFFAFVSLIGVAASAAAQTGSITGRVTDGATGRALGGATVQAMSGTQTASSALSSDDGRYRLLDLPAGTYDVAARRIGYVMTRAERVSVVAGGTATADFSLAAGATNLDPIVTTASRGAAAERMVEAAASIAVVSAEQMSAKPTALVTDYLKTLPGVSVSSAGIGQSNTVTRGFNNAFSTQMLGLQDYRFSGLPSLRANLPLLFTGTNEDIDRIEVLNGPAAALYGPNSANGVLHIITKSPFQSKGTSFTVDGGGQAIFRGAARSALVFGPRRDWGVKLSGEYFTGTDWPDRDANLPSVFPSTAPPERAGQPLARGTAVRRYTTEGRLDYRAPNSDLENIATIGYTHILNSNEITTVFGPTQGRNWSYTSFQDRIRYKKFFAQAFYNGSNSGNSSPTDASGSFYLTTGIPIVDNSTVMVFQAQQGFDLFAAKMVVGADYIATKPKSRGSVYGRYETSSAFGNTDITERGAYLHGTIPLTTKLDLSAAIRGDQTNRLEGSQVSPRLGLVFKANPWQNIRATFSRAFNSPAGFEYFLDQVINPFQAPGFALRAIGNPSKKGWQFDRSCDATINTGLCMHSPWVAQGGGTAVASSAANAFPGFVAALPGIVNALPTLTATQKAQLTGLLAQLNPILAPLRPTPAELGTVLFLNSPVTASAVADIAPLRPSFNNTWELGYKGIVQERLRVAIDLWYQIRGDVGRPIALANPFVLYDPTTLGGYLVTKITEGLVAAGQSQAQAQATANASAAALVPLMAALPQGTLAFTSPLNDDQSFIVTYFGGSGTVHVRGLDLALDYQMTDDWMVSGTYSHQGKIVFPEVGGASNPLMSNSPKHRASATGRYNRVAGGLGFETTVRYADAYPVNSGYYNSLTPNVFNPAFSPYAAVRAQTQVDLGMSYRFLDRKLTWGLNASNVFDDREATFAGTPAIGRLIMTRLRYEW